MLSALLVFTAIIAPSFASGTWFQNLDQAKTAAQEGNKSILLLFRAVAAEKAPDAEEIAPGIELKNKLFSSPEFKELADSSLILLEADITGAGAALARQYPPYGFPFVYLLNAQGVAYWMRPGTAPTTEQYLSDLKKGLETKSSLLASYDESRKVSGLDRAKLLDKTLRALPENLRLANRNLYEEIITNDTDDVLGYARQKEESMKKRDSAKIQGTQNNELNELASKHITPLLKTERKRDAITLIERYLEKKDLTVLTRQRGLFLASQIYLVCGEIDKSLEALDSVQKLDNNSDLSKEAAENARKIKENRALIEQQLQAQK